MTSKLDALHFCGPTGDHPLQHWHAVMIDTKLASLCHYLHQQARSLLYPTTDPECLISNRDRFFRFWAIAACSCQPSVTGTVAGTTPVTTPVAYPGLPTFSPYRAIDSLSTVDLRLYWRARHGRIGPLARNEIRSVQTLRLNSSPDLDVAVAKGASASRRSPENQAQKEHVPP
jgi:hypothetical protein